MFKLLSILLLAFFLASPSLTENIEAVASDDNDDWEPGFISSVSDLWALLMRAKDISSEELEKVLNDPRIDKLLSDAGAVLRYGFTKVLQFFKDLLADKKKEEAAEAFIAEHNTDAGEVTTMLGADWDTLKDLIYAITEAAKGGAEALLRIINDPDIREKISRLGYFGKIQIEKLIDFLLKKVESDEQASNSAPSSRSRRSVAKQIDFIDFDFDVSSVKLLLEMIKEAVRDGYNGLVKLIESGEFKEKLQKLPGYLATSVKTYIQWLEKQLKGKQTENTESLKAIVDSGPALPASLMSEDAMSLYNKIKNLVSETAAKGKIELLELLESERLQELVDKLPAKILRSAAQTWINAMKKVINIDMDDIKEVYYKVKSQVEEAAAQGQDKLVELLQSENFKNIVSKLPESIQKHLVEWIDNLN